MDLKASFLFYNDLNGLPLYLEQPIERITARSFLEVPAALRSVDQWAQKQKYYIAGYIQYEVGYALMGLPCETFNREAPLIDFYVFDKSSTSEKVDKCDAGALQKIESKVPAAFFNFSAPQNQSLYNDNLAKVQEQLKAGNSYQINYTFLNTCQSYGSTKELFLNLYKTQKSRYAVCAELPELSILSLSPELFFSKIKNKITTKPMKGTLPIGAAEIPKHLADKLSAENLMIVDLLRNDLAKVAKPETVAVTQLMLIEQYSTLQQIVSTIEGELEPQVHFSQIIKALFPCGSITGAPKRRTMEILKSLEGEPRGLYTGTIGYISPEGDMQFNVAIRTLWGSEQWSYGVGGGIVLDSVAPEEYAEALLKAQFIKSTNNRFSIFETMLADNKKIIDLESHLERLRKSAEYFGFTWNENTVLTAAQTAASSPEKMRVKLQLFNDGRVEAFAEPLQEIAQNKKLAIANTPVNSKNIFFQHKTSERNLYDAEYFLNKEKGFYDVLFFNEKQEITEASRHNIFLRLGQEWFTPPVSCGLLPGVERQKFIIKNNAQEKILYKKDLSEAIEIVLTNSVRGAVRVEVAL